MTFFVYQPFRKANMWPKNFKRIKVQLLLANSMWLISYDFLRACFHTMPDFARKGNAFPAFIAISDEKKSCGGSFLMKIVSGHEGKQHLGHGENNAWDNKYNK